MCVQAHVAATVGAAWSDALRQTLRGAFAVSLAAAQLADSGDHMES